MSKRIKLYRPDKLLQKQLIRLAYSLVTLTIFLLLFFLYPQNILIFIVALAITTVYCLILSIKSLKAGEEAINYGGFANEIIRLNNNPLRIDDAKGNAVIENDASRELFRHKNILSFLQSNISNDRVSTLALQRLKTALQNTVAEKVLLSLNLRLENSMNENWFELELKPISLKKTDIFDSPFSLGKTKKDIYMYWSIRDVTAQHNMDQVFQDERKYLHDFLDYLPVGVYLADDKQNVEYCNLAFADYLQLKREDITNKNIRDYIAPNSPLPAENKNWQGSLFFLRSGEDKPAELFVRQDTFRYENQIKTRVACINNLPNDEALKDKLGQSIEEAARLFDFAPVGIVFVGDDDLIYKSNLSAQKLLGIFDKTSTKLLGALRQSDKKALEEEFRHISSGRKTIASCNFAIKDGSKSIQAFITPIYKLHEKNPAYEGFIVYMIDATEQKNIELQFAQAQKMQAMGQLAGGVAHDFNNLLTAIIGFCDLLLQRHSIGDPSFTDLYQIKNNAARAAGLVRQLLAFSRKQMIQPKLIDVTEGFIDLSQMLERVLGENVKLKFHHGENLGFIRVDPVQFSQVIINLAVNAKDAMNGNGLLSISTKTEYINSGVHSGEESIKSGHFVVIEVKDSGCGISEENLPRIFEPFYSTKQNVVGSGTGLGLATVYGIVRQTEGFIKVNSVLEKGTTFSIYLPRFESNMLENEKIADKKEITSTDGTPVIQVREQASSAIGINQKFIFGLNVAAIDNSKNTATEAGIKILFVEDEDSVRSFALRALKKKGYEVTGCNCAENALEVLEESKDFDMLITDMVMPGMNGIALAQKVKDMIPDIKIILASGYAEEIVRNELSEDDEFEFLAKPFSLGDLSQKVFSVLKNE